VEELWSLEEESFEELKLVEPPPSSPSPIHKQFSTLVIDCLEYGNTRQGVVTYTSPVEAVATGIKNLYR